MPSFPYVPILPARVRKDPLGPQTLNQLQANAEDLDELARVEHFSDGQHNALEVPWVLGHVTDGSPPTGDLFNTAFGGGTLTRPATGEYTINAASGVVPTSVTTGSLLYSAMVNTADSAIESKPHTTTIEAVSATSFKVRIRALTSALGAGDGWGDVNRNFDFALHAPPQDADSSLLASHLLKRRRDFLTEASTDWNALVQNQATINKAALLEHTSAGVHNVNRIARAVGWFRPTTGPAYSATLSQGVTSVTLISTGVIEVVIARTMSSTSKMVCFPEAQPSTKDELVIINGRGFGTGAGTTKFRFYIYAFSGGSWARADRSFFASMFGE